jgi:hypothetical protein
MQKQVQKKIRENEKQKILHVKPSCEIKSPGKLGLKVRTNVTKRLPRV